MSLRAEVLLRAYYWWWLIGISLLIGGPLPIATSVRSHWPAQRLHLNQSSHDNLALSVFTYTPLLDDDEQTVYVYAAVPAAVSVPNFVDPLLRRAPTGVQTGGGTSASSASTSAAIPTAAAAISVLAGVGICATPTPDIYELLTETTGPAEGAVQPGTDFYGVGEGFHNVHPHPNGNASEIVQSNDWTGIEAATSDVVVVFQTSRMEGSRSSLPAETPSSSLRDRRYINIAFSASQKNGCLFAEEAHGSSDSRTEPDLETRSSGPSHTGGPLIGQ